MGTLHTIGGVDLTALQNEAESLANTIAVTSGLPGIDQRQVAFATICVMEALRKERQRSRG